MSNPTVTRGSGNVFADLGLPEADEAMAKSEIVIAIHDAMDEHGMLDETAASLAGIEVNSFRLIMRGRVGSYSLDQLAGILASISVEWA